MNTSQGTFTIVNEKGLHARASAKLVDMVEQFEASATIEKDGIDACGDSIMGLLMLVASKGTQVNIKTEGVQAQELLNALGVLIANRFGEDQ
ncbi:MAG: HPr family phosphocarrier protein [Rhodobacteraceae bacterium]|jgi:phosphocarrier protein HPr|nr:HPr family phosphocarrier protein [Paracoccaceae bacterium]NCV31075.1 HPr family phosphocarrier protein [Paracoccaceae bacterium]NCV67856.1 HPr family phosphocarrier protein [Paracoccaceae bacterium]NCW04017.1 HPr family phosphocarrier protein [Paracoccaceae bacterium]NCW60648.1 HPr family phosphocarrier protein [Paracoccaceae bacterium]